MGKTNTKIVIIDANSLINRAYYAIRYEMVTSNGVYTKAVYGFLNMLYKIYAENDFSHIAICWDLKAPTFRHKAYSEYKAGRKKMPDDLASQIPILKKILSIMNITNVEMEGFEADDLIGTISNMAENADMESLIITGDKDALQLSSNKTKVLITKKGISQFKLYDDEVMKEEYSLTPTQFIDLKGIMGDKSDNIPGIPGVGEKTGIKLLERFDTLENMLSHTSEIEGEKLKQKIEENAQIALMSKKLATINRNVPIDIRIEDLICREPDFTELRKIYKELELKTFLKKIPSGASEGFEFEPNDEANITYERLAEEAAEIKEVSISDAADIDILTEIKKNSLVILEVHSVKSHVENQVIDEILILSENILYRIYGKILDSDLKKVLSVLQDLEIQFSGHDLITSYYPLIANDFAPEISKFDTKVAEYVINSSKKNDDYSLTALQKEYFNLDIEYNNEDLKLKLLTIRKIIEEQKKIIDDMDLSFVLYNIELPLITVLANMEFAGVWTDVDVLEAAGEDLEKSISILENRIHMLAGKTFNISSPKQVGEVLFEDLKLPAGKKTKSGYSTGKDVLEKLQRKHPIAGEILEFRKITKLKSTYVEGLKSLICSDGKIRPKFMQTVAATGRISCTEPNLQNIPIRNEEGRALRKAFKPSNEGGVFVSADYSQIELRVLAHLSKDENLISAFKHGDDIHRITASRVFNVPYDKVTKLDRSRAKAVNFGVIYGMSGFGLSEELNLGIKEAERYIEEYFAIHTGVKKFMDECVANCKKKGYVLTDNKRRRYIPEINSSRYIIRKLGERVAMNSPIQGTAADIIKIAMCRVDNEIRKRNLKSKLVLQIHDELMVDALKEESDEVQEILQTEMKQAVDWKDVELSVDVSVGSDWYEVK